MARSRLGGGGATASAASAYVLLGLGYDTNPALVDDSVEPSQADSPATELFAAIELPLGAVTALVGVPFFLTRLRRLA